MSNKSIIQGEVTIRKRPGAMQMHPALFRNIMQLHWDRGDYDGLIVAADFELVGNQKFPPQESLTLEKRQQIMVRIADRIYECALDAAEKFNQV
jgi:hypothetical protein